MLTYRLSALSESQLQSITSREIDITTATSRARAIVAAVRSRGDKALRTYARQFDGYKSGPLTVAEDDIQSSPERVSKLLLDALRLSKRRIEAFHRRQMSEPFEFSDSTGTYGENVVPLDRVGVYVPGGSAAYMSTVLMACVPARIAGVKDLAICTPGRAGQIPDEILAAASLCDVREVHPVGGAHSIAAMAYGTSSIPKVQKIVGPGGAYVTAAKLLVRNDCEIDFLAGPSELLIVADDTADPESLALDMLAQLEHDPLARALLLCTSEDVMDEAKSLLSQGLANSARRDITDASSSRGAIFILVDRVDDALSFSNRYAPEHLLIDVDRPKLALKKVTSAGSVFIGKHSSVAFGDYCSGTNHILPTMGVAAAKSSLTVNDFLKVIPYQEMSASGAQKLSKAVETLANSEGLPAHAAAALARARKVKK